MPFFTLLLAQNVSAFFRISRSLSFTVSHTFHTTKLLYHQSAAILSERSLRAHAYGMCFNTSLVLTNLHTFMHALIRQATVQKGTTNSVVWQSEKERHTKRFPAFNRLPPVTVPVTERRRKKQSFLHFPFLSFSFCFRFFLSSTSENLCK